MKYKVLIFICLFLLILNNQTKAAENGGYRIEVNNVFFKDSKVVYLGAYLNQGTYALDSARITDGIAIFQSAKKLNEGQYFILIDKYVKMELLIGNQPQNIKIGINQYDILSNTITGSHDTELLWKYIRYQAQYKKEREKIEDKLKASDLSQDMRNTISEQLDSLDHQVWLYAKDEAAKYANEWFGVFIKACIPISPPIENPLTTEDLTANNDYLKKHFFDNMNLQDPRFWRTDFFVRSLNGYMDNCIAQKPDSLASAASLLVSKTIGNSICFKNMLSHFINESMNSQLVGHENIWARLFEDYISMKNVPWISDTQLVEMQGMYNHIRYNRVGMDAQNLALKTMDGNTINTNEIKAKYTLIYFYDPDCALCQTETPAIHDSIYSQYKGQGFEVVAFNIGIEENKWRNYIEDKKLTDWINCSDFDSKSNYWKYYDVPNTPSIYLLDEKKKIIMKNIDSKSLKKILNNLYSQKNGIN